MNSPEVEHCIDLLEQLFINRRDTYSLQEKFGAYMRICSAITRETISKHLFGKHTLGIYQLDKAGKVKWLCIDIDNNLENQDSNSPLMIQAVESVVSRFEHYQLKPLIEYSGRRGYHLWVFFTDLVPALEAKLIGNGIVSEVDSIPEVINIEVFPKQTEITSDRSFGNLVKLPLGIHQAKGKRALFCTIETMNDNNNGGFLDQIKILESITTIPHEQVREIAEEFGGGSISNDNSEGIPSPEGFIYMKDPIPTIYDNCQALRELRDKAIKTGKLTNEERRNIASILVHVPEGEHEIHEIMKHCTSYNGKGDYNPDMTQRHIKNIKNYLKPVTCAQLCGCEKIRQRARGGSPIAFAYSTNQSTKLIIDTKEN